MKCKAGEPDEASDAKRACIDNEDNKCFFYSNFSLCSNQSNHRTEIDCLSFQQEIRGGYGFFLNKYSDSQCYWKQYSDFDGGKKICFRVFVI